MELTAANNDRAADARALAYLERSQFHALPLPPLPTPPPPHRRAWDGEGWGEEEAGRGGGGSEGEANRGGEQGDGARRAGSGEEGDQDGVGGAGKAEEGELVAEAEDVAMLKVLLGVEDTGEGKDKVGLLERLCESLAVSTKSKAPRWVGVDPLLTLMPPQLPRFLGYPPTRLSGR